MRGHVRGEARAPREKTFILRQSGKRIDQQVLWGAWYGRRSGSKSRGREEEDRVNLKTREIDGE